MVSVETVAVRLLVVVIVVAVSLVGDADPRGFQNAPLGWLGRQGGQSLVVLGVVERIETSLGTVGLGIAVVVVMVEVIGVRRRTGKGGDG